MSDNQHLVDLLVATVKHLKALHATLSAVMVDESALRQSVLVEPEDVSRYKEKIQKGTEITKPLVNAAMRSYDEMIRRIAGSEAGSVMK
jgi:hypothetical protein